MDSNGFSMCFLVNNNHMLKWLQIWSVQNFKNFKIEVYMDMKKIKCSHW